MAYDLDQFIADCRSILSQDPGPAGREQVRQNLERLLANKDFIAQYCGDNVPRGLKVLYEDQHPGASSCRQPISMLACSAHASCSATTKKCVR